MRLVIIGAGGHGKVVADCADMIGRYEQILFLDANAGGLQRLVDWEVADKPEAFERFINSDTEFFVAIGNNRARAQWLERIQSDGGRIATLIHPSAVVSKRVSIGKGSLVLANAAINILAELGEGCIVNTGATIDHDCRLGNYVHVAPGCNLAGTVSLSNYVFSGAGSTLIPSVSVGEHSTIGAGAAVVSDIPANVVAVGTPAKVIKQLPED